MLLDADRWARLLLLAGLVSGCAFGGTRGGDAGGGLDAAREDTGVSEDASVSEDAGVTRADAGWDAGGLLADAGRDAGSLRADAGRRTDAGSLSPDLGLPDPSGTPCASPGSLGECPGIEVCRFFSPAEGRCESCAPCGNLNAACSSSAECDILFMCFAGRCTNFCTLGSFECGPPADCLDIGHPTRGVCRP